MNINFGLFQLILKIDEEYSFKFGPLSVVIGPSVSKEDRLRQKIVELLAADKKISAIKLYREQTGASLADAKTAVEKIQAESPSL